MDKTADNKFIGLLAASLVLFLMLSAVVAAQSERPNIWQRTINVLTDVAQLKFLDNDMEKLGAFIKIIVWLVVFTVINTVLRRAGGGGVAGGMFAGGASGVISFAIATLSSLLLPTEILVGIAEGYSTLTAAILVGILALIVWNICYNVMPGFGLQGGTLSFARLAFLVLVFYVLERITGVIEGRFTIGEGSSLTGIIGGVYIMPKIERTYRMVKRKVTGKKWF